MIIPAQPAQELRTRTGVLHQSLPRGIMLLWEALMGWPTPVPSSCQLPFAPSSNTAAVS